MDQVNLDIHFKNLAVLNEADSPVISCYINNEAGRAGYRDTLDARIREIRKSLPQDQRAAFEEALGRIEMFLASDVKRNAQGIAVFSRVGDAPFFDALQFRIPLPTTIAVDSVPHLYELVKLKDMYHRYLVVISTDSHARIVEVNVGKITQTLWTERPELRKRVGREWTKEHYQNHQRDRTHKFFKEKIELLERLFADREHTHLVLAGNSRSAARLRDSLPKHLRERLVDVLPIDGRTSTEDVVNATLSTFADYEQAESLETAGLLLDELRVGGLAVAGTEATLKALDQGQVDSLVLTDSYEAPPGWSCRSCGAVGVDAHPRGCPRCGERDIGDRNLKEHMVRTAERLGADVEIVRNSDVLLEIGGVGCLLRYLTPDQRVPGTSSTRV